MRSARIVHSKRPIPSILQKTHKKTNKLTNTDSISRRSSKNNLPAFFEGASLPLFEASSVCLSPQKTSFSLRKKFTIKCGKKVCCRFFPLPSHGIFCPEKGLKLKYSLWMCTVQRFSSGTRRRHFVSTVSQFGFFGGVFFYECVNGIDWLCCCIVYVHHQ